MKISKFQWSVLVAFATVALIAPQQVEAILVDGRVSGQTTFTGGGTITQSGGISSSGIISGDPLVQKDSAARIVIQGTGQDFTYNLTVVTTAVPEVGSTLGLLAIGLVAVERLRRKIATRQNRYA